jgi:virginiamycin B lyase
MHRSGIGRLFSFGAAVLALALSTPAHAIVTVGTIALQPGSRPTNTAAAPNGWIWFTEEGANKIGALDPGGILHEYTINTPGSRPNAVAIDGSGRVWFTEANRDRLGVLNPSTGFIVEYYWGGSSLGLSGIEVTGDGKVWFTMFNRNQIGVMDPGFLTVRYYSWTTAAIGPLRIKKDAFNRLWFTEYLSNRVGVLDPYWNFVYDFYYAGSVSSPWGIDVDSNGKVWFTENAAGTFSRLDPNTGVINEWLTIGGASSRPRDIDTTRNAAGQTVVVWAESGGSGNIGVLNAATGNKQGVPVTPSSEATGVAIDLQRNVWFTEAGTSQVDGFSLQATGIARRPGSTPDALFAAALPFAATPAPAVEDRQGYRILQVDDDKDKDKDEDEDKGKHRDKQAKIEKKKCGNDDLKVTEVKEHKPKHEQRRVR